MPSRRAQLHLQKLEVLVQLTVQCSLELEPRSAFVGVLFEKKWVSLVDEKNHRVKNRALYFATKPGGGSVAHTDLDQLRTQNPPQFWLSYAHRFGSVAHTEL